MTTTSTSTKPRKRRESFGAVRTLPSGRVQASYVGPDGERHKAPDTFDTLGDARAWLAIQQARISEGRWASLEREKAADVTPFVQYAETWITTRTNPRGEPLRARTADEYRRLLAGPLASFHDKRLAGIAPAAVRAWYAKQVDTGHKTQAARAYGLMRSILATAVGDGLIPSNPCAIRGAQNATSGRKVEPPTPAELATIVERISDRYKAAVLLAAWAGVRFGELTELRRRDLTIGRDADGNVLTITVSVTRAVTYTQGRGYVVGVPKTAAGVRSIALPPHVNGAVVEHLREYVDASPDALLFPAADGTAHLAQSTLVKHYYPARAAAGRDDMPWHALRHYGATRAALAGATLKELQARLGHSTVGAAMRYQHEAGRDAEIAARMSELN